MLLITQSFTSRSYVYLLGNKSSRKVMNYKSYQITIRATRYENQTKIKLHTFSGAQKSVAQTQKVDPNIQWHLHCSIHYICLLSSYRARRIGFQRVWLVQLTCFHCIILLDTRTYSQLLLTTTGSSHFKPLSVCEPSPTRICWLQMSSFVLFNSFRTSSYATKNIIFFFTKNA